MHSSKWGMESSDNTMKNPRMRAFRGIITTLPTNNDGAVSFNQLRAAIAMSGLDICKAQLHALMLKSDPQAAGFVCKKSFLQFLDGTESWPAAPEASNEERGRLGLLGQRLRKRLSS